ncbi:MAG: DUF938 domain-containing protein [Gammaproteobacteria bacterium]|nr:DUF938 domain-containing protein [Gammaproteobacteria bacterium]NND39294.1 DUF938 domain-containing protein [Pseudomonadales bacterium]MBT8150017.1 DUF938 domain-containing protein [Gammaproteobacteria bacterium]NNL10390.1 DUF938 domain-containing protein [Pseudomonadales bacterium]NNM10373.1 DUF938 domain-containing protein [Pseudomonadales bacterium]
MLRTLNDLPSAPACERNREPILQALLPYLCSNIEAPRCVLEIGSGTGQHAWYFTQRFAESSNFAKHQQGAAGASAEHVDGGAQGLKNLGWQCSDVADNLPIIDAWRAAIPKDVESNNFPAPFELDLAKKNWPNKQYDFVFTANTLHIVSWPLVLAFCECAVSTLAKNGKLFIYGPFNYNGSFTSSSNAAFDANLRARDALSGIRDFAAVCEALQVAAANAGFAMPLVKDIEMPANNRLLVFEKK